jgi:hypothetical protein
MTRVRDLRVPVSPDEERRIRAKGRALGYPDFAPYARAILADPFGPFMKNRLADLVRDLYDVERALRAGDDTAPARLQTLQTRVATWIE